MTSFVVKNNAESLVADNPLAQAATTLNVTASGGANFPSTFPFLITIWDETAHPDPSDDSGMEICRCTARSTDALTIVRGQESTSDVAHALGERVAMLITAGILNDGTYGLATKLDGIESGATTDQTGAEIKTAYEAEANAFTDTKNTKLAGVEDNATADQTGTEIKTAYEAEANAYTDTKNTKLAGIESSADVTDAVNVASSIHGVAGKTPPIDADELGLIDSAAANVLKKLTWTNVKATLKTYFDTLYNNYTHPNHTGAVTSTGDGATAITDDAVTYAKIQNVTGTDKILGRSTAGAGIVEEIPCTAAGRAILDDANAAAQRTTLGAAGISSGTYSGDSSVNKAIPHGLGVTPKLVLIVGSMAAGQIRLMRSGYIHYLDHVAGAVKNVTAWNSTNFYVGNSDDYTYSANLTSTTYYWVAIG